MATQLKIEIAGVKCTLQHPGMREAMRIMDRTMVTNNFTRIPYTSNELFLEEVLEHVLIEPVLDWNTIEELERPGEFIDELISKAMSFLKFQR